MLVDENGNADQVIAVSTGHGTNVSSSRLLSGTVLSYLVTDGDLGVFGNITNPVRPACQPGSRCVAVPTPDPRIGLEVGAVSRRDVR